jgi:hypothetical protein
MDYKKIIEASELYWTTGGREGAIANLSYANLSDAKLNGAIGFALITENAIAILHSRS